MAEEEEVVPVDRITAVVVGVGMRDTTNRHNNSSSSNPHPGTTTNRAVLRMCRVRIRGTEGRPVVVVQEVVVVMRAMIGHGHRTPGPGGRRVQVAQEVEEATKDRTRRGEGE